MWLLCAVVGAAVVSVSVWLWWTMPQGKGRCWPRPPAICFFFCIGRLPARRRRRRRRRGEGLLEGVKEAVRRGRMLRCKVCNLKGATLGCLKRTCRTSYHLPCARAHGCLLQVEPYVVACPEHVGSLPGGPSRRSGQRRPAGARPVRAVIAAPPPPPQPQPQRAAGLSALEQAAAALDEAEQYYEEDRLEEEEQQQQQPYGGGGQYGGGGEQG
jgi:hypothetical protein